MSKLPELTKLSEWTPFNSKISFSNKSLQTILNFYLFNCPVKRQSIRSKSFKEHGWQSKYFSQLQKRLKKCNEQNIIFKRVSVKKLYSALEDTNQLGKVDCSKKVVIYHDDRTSMSTLFGAIRNAFAHGSFQIKTVNRVRYYCLENRKTPVGKQKYFDTEIRTLMVLKESTLLEWIRIIESGYSPKQSTSTSRPKRK